MTNLILKNGKYYDPIQLKSIPDNILLDDIPDNTDYSKYNVMSSKVLTNFFEKLKQVDNSNKTIIIDSLPEMGGRND